MSHPIALITGATSGIGKATAELLAKNNFRLILTGRRKERLDQLAVSLGQKTEVLTLTFDVSRRSEVVHALHSIPPEWKAVDVLVNNAGNAHGLDYIQSGNVDDWDAMIDINVKGLLYVSREIMPGMVERRHGHIINLGSIAGKEVYEKGGVYCASKFAVDAISQSMRKDLNPFGIRVTSIDPGLVETEFSLVRFKGDQKKADDVYRGLKPLKAEDVADVIWFAVSRPPHVTIADLILLPTAQASATVVHRQS